MPPTSSHPNTLEIFSEEWLNCYLMVDQHLQSILEGHLALILRSFPPSSTSQNISQLFLLTSHMNTPWHRLYTTQLFLQQTIETIGAFLDLYLNRQDDDDQVVPSQNNILLNLNQILSQPISHLEELESVIKASRHLLSPGFANTLSDDNIITRITEVNDWLMNQVKLDQSIRRVRNIIKNNEEHEPFPIEPLKDAYWIGDPPLNLIMQNQVRITRNIARLANWIFTNMRS